jgi:AraC family transcriptional regulator
MGGFSLKEFSQPPFRRLPRHEHRDASICFVASGSYTERVGSTAWEVAPKAMVFKPASEYHEDQFGKLGGTCLLIEVSPERLRTIAPFSRVLEKPSLARNQRLSALGREIYREFTDPDACSPLAVEGLVLETIAEAARAKATDPSRKAVWLRQALELIHDRFCESLTLSTVAGEIGMHPSHLARTFRRHYRSSIGAYVRRLRVDRAFRDLAETALSLSEIGLRLGFFDQSHFTRVFKQQTGLTPAQFRAASKSRNRRTTPHGAS